ncbi:class I SAM-dependent methyltransferase [Candidatus Poribacteria bacterium]|nr:class I SAM-dependent methyltransferase [Candidatus Poribacteria bacterium]
MPGKDWCHSYFSRLYGAVYQGPLFNAEATEEEAEFLAGVFADTGPGLILDIGCGFGRHIMELRRRQIPVLGMDRFMEMLQRQSKRTRAAVCADMRHPPFGAESLSGAYCVFNTFGYFGDEENRAMLRTWSRMLRTGGRLVLHVPNRPGMARLVRTMKPSHRMTESFAVSEHYEYNAESKCLCGAGVWRLDQAEQQWQFRLRLYTQSEMRRMLASAGMDVLDVFDDYDRSPFEPRISTQMVVVAQKR